MMRASRSVGHCTVPFRAASTSRSIVRL
jgi:hypothetical protein